MKPKKSLGQNFLRDKTVLEKIIQTAGLRPADNIIEVGPGKGVLTEQLAKYAGKVLAIEIDFNLASKLKSHFHKNDKIKIINGDILKINLPELIEQNNFQKYKVIANIPYYITSPIIQLFLKTKFPPSEMILMAQKEVAERICNRPGQMSILSVSVQYYSKPELLFYVDKKSFYPVPKVDSAVIKISRIHRRSSTSEISEVELLKKEIKIKNFFRIVKAGFSAKRKTLANNLSSSLKIDKKEVEEKLNKAGISPTQRAQELTVEDWKKISELLKKSDFS